jgi:hypothetical protein
VRCLNLRPFRLPVIAIAFLCILSSLSRADPLTNLTLIDLGTGTPTFAMGANGGIVIAGSGLTAYPFQKAQDTSPDPKKLLSTGFPLPDRAPTQDPMTYGDPSRAYGILSNAHANGNGVVVGIEATGVAGHYGSSDVYFSQQAPDGSWGAPTHMWTGGPPSFMGLNWEPIASITGINAKDEVLGSGTAQNAAGPFVHQTALLYNLDTKSLLDLSTLAVLEAGRWNTLSPIAIDDRGRILLTGSPLTGPDHTLLLTPEGVSSDPLAVPAPEPGALAFAVLTITALTLRRAARSRRQP